MYPARSKEGHRVWHAPECAVSIAYGAELLDGIRISALEAFCAFPRGGAEIGGVLFGRFQNGQVCIEAWRDLGCEHAFGPSFVLSDKDRARLAGLLRAPETDPALAGLAPVGWYHSHTRSGIFLSTQDLEVHERYFREPWHIALVLKPSIAGTQAGFFARDAAGKLRVDASPCVFPLVPLAGRVLARPGQIPPEPAKAEEKPAPVVAPDVAGPEAAVAPPSFLLAAPRETRPWRGLLAAVLLAASVYGLYATRGRWLPLIGRTPAGAESSAAAPRVSALGLGVFDHGGQLQIRWNGAATVFDGARGGSLDIYDGGARTVIVLEPVQLATGSVMYVRQTGRVEVRLEVEQPDGRRASQFTTFVGAAPEPAAQPGAGLDELRAQRDELQRQLRDARAELVNQTLLIQRLQQMLRDAQPGRPATPAR